MIKLNPYGLSFLIKPPITMDTMKWKRVNYLFQIHSAIISNICNKASKKATPYSTRGYQPKKLDYSKSHLQELEAKMLRSVL